MSIKLHEAISLIKEGKKQEAYHLLSEIIKSDPTNEMAWLWMSAVVSEDRRRYCIKKVLGFNPNNQQAIQALEKMAKSKSETPQTFPPNQQRVPERAISQSSPPQQPGNKIAKGKCISGMEKVILKPVLSKMIVFWLTFSCVILVFVLLFNWEDISDLFMFTLLVALVLFQTFVFSLAFYKLPYFNIEINESHIMGPRSLGGGWRRIRIPVQDIDFSSTNSTFQWLGFYIIKSYKGNKLSVWGFDEKQFVKLLDLIKSMKKQINSA